MTHFLSDVVLATFLPAGRIAVVLRLAAKGVATWSKDVPTVPTLLAHGCFFRIGWYPMLSPQFRDFKSITWFSTYVRCSMSHARVTVCGRAGIVYDGPSEISEWCVSEHLVGGHPSSTCSVVHFGTVSLSTKVDPESNGDMVGLYMHTHGFSWYLEMQNRGILLVVLEHFHYLFTYPITSHNVYHQVQPFCTVVVLWCAPCAFEMASRKVAQQAQPFLETHMMFSKVCWSCGIGISFLLSHNVRHLKHS